MKKRVRFLKAWQQPGDPPIDWRVGQVTELDVEVAQRLCEGDAPVAEVVADAPPAPPPQRAEPPADADTQIRAALKRERERVSQSLALGRRFHVDVQARIDAGDSVEQVRQHILDQMEREQRNRPTGSVQVTQDGRESFARTAVVGVCTRTGRVDTLTDEERKMTLEIGNYSLLRLAEECLRRAGLAVPSQPDEIVRMALRGPAITSFSLARHSDAITVGTSDFPLILANVANKEMLAGARGARVTYPLWCKIGSGADFKAMSRLKLSEAGELQQVPEFGAYQTTKFSEQRETITIVTWGRAFNLSRQAIINDDLAAFTDVPRAFGRAAAYKPNIEAVKQLAGNGNMSDGVALFATARGNYSASSSYDLGTVDEARAGIANMWKLLGLIAAMKHGELGTEVGIYNGAILKTLLTPVTGHLNALTVLEASGYLGTNTIDGNPLRGLNLACVAEPLLENTNITGYSTTAYYGFADPAEAPVIEVAFLNGNQSPYLEEVENVGTAADGRVFKVRLDCAAGKVDWRGAVMENGA